MSQREMDLVMDLAAFRGNSLEPSPNFSPPEPSTTSKSKLSGEAGPIAFAKGDVRARDRVAS
jgi:hypothetical protein